LVGHSWRAKHRNNYWRDCNHFHNRHPLYLSPKKNI